MDVQTILVVVLFVLSKFLAPVCQNIKEVQMDHVEKWDKVIATLERLDAEWTFKVGDEDVIEGNIWAEQ